MLNNEYQRRMQRNHINVSAPEAIERKAKKAIKKRVSNSCEHGDLGSLGYKHGSIVTCPYCGQRAEVW